MKNLKLFTFFGFVNLIICVQSFSAEVLPDFSNYLDQTMTQVESSLHNLPEANSNAGRTTFILQDINVDFTPSVSFGLGNEINLTISPEIDIVLVPHDTAY